MVLKISVKLIVFNKTNKNMFILARVEKITKKWDFGRCCVGCVCGRHRHAADRNGVGNSTPDEGPRVDGEGESRARQRGGEGKESRGE